jgi:hypothetical protein
MRKLQTSDTNPTMVASRTFDSILQQIQSSNLNFQLQISPFSAILAFLQRPGVSFDALKDEAEEKEEIAEEEKSRSGLRMWTPHCGDP